MTTFDPETYKSSARAQWQAVAEQWHRWGPTLGSWLGEATEQRLLLCADLHYSA